MKSAALSLFLVLASFAYADESVVYSFQGGTDGWGSPAELIGDQAGNLYGMTLYGGNGQCTGSTFSGCGTIFELSPDGKGGWTKTILYNFKGQKDGQWPISRLLMDSSGNLFGTTAGAGLGHGCPPTCGSAFELTKNSDGTWSFTVLHAFNGGMNGGQPVGGLTTDSAGNLYGTAELGGKNNVGTLFQLSFSNGTWTFKRLHSFSGPDGAFPNGSLAVGPDANFYGTAVTGGVYGGGVLYRLSKDHAGKWIVKGLHSFGSSKDDSGLETEPGDIAMDMKGNIYGISKDGPKSTYAYAYRISFGTWKRKNIHQFSRANGDGDRQVNYLTLDSLGNVFGATGDAPGKVYRLSEQNGKWGEDILHLFEGPPDGMYPGSGLFLDATGNLWGMTNIGGSNNDGTIFEITQ
jgi:uncharacterized repeat protein (TIGR03803 family)